MKLSHNWVGIIAWSKEYKIDSPSSTFITWSSHLRNEIHDNFPTTIVTFVTYCFRVVKMISKPDESLAFSTYLEEIEDAKKYPAYP